MSAVIKSRDEAAAVTHYRPALLGEARPRAPAPEILESGSPPDATVDDERRALLDRLAALEAAGQAATERAYRDGHSCGRRDADTRERDRLEALEQAVELALARQTEALSQAHRVGAELARLALARIFESPESMRELVERTLALQLAALDRDLVATIGLSAEDFPDPAAVEPLRSRCPGLVLDIAGDRPAGFCVIRSTLGQVDASIGSQWSRLAELLADMADGE